MNRINVAAKQVTRALPAHGLHLAGSAAHSPRKQSKTLQSCPKCQEVSNKSKRQQKSRKCRPIFVKICTNLIVCRLVISCVYNSGRLQSLQATQATQATTTSVHYDLKAMAQGWTQGWLNQTLVRWKHFSQAIVRL